MHLQFTATLEKLARQNVELQNELAQSRQHAANEFAALTQDIRGAPLWDAGDGNRCGHAFAGEAERLLRGARRVARLERNVQGARDDAAKATEPTPNATNIDDDVGTALLDDAHDLQGCSSQHRVPSNRQRRSCN